ncbi:alpha/beta hydrolase [Nocardia brasiliensis]|uniref:alpha/beta hydrolase n=1 Tax=Nocardia brasiliensis TaxID=37326 RepID=UPI0033E245E9
MGGASAGHVFSAARFRPLLLDLYVPEGVTRPPIVVWIHGGSFSAGDRRWLHRTFPDNSVFDELVRAGIACASIDYRLSMEATWPAQRDDVAAAIEFVRTHADEYGYNGERLGTWGDSAGGHLALTAALTNPRVSAVAAWYPITDIASMLDGDESFSPWLGGWPSLMPEVVAQASPITHVTAAAPPCLLVHDAADSMVPATQSERLVARMREARVAVECRRIAGAGHGFEGYADVTGLIGEAVGFFGARLGRC